MDLALLQDSQLLTIGGEVTAASAVLTVATLGSGLGHTTLDMAHMPLMICLINI
jgi:hypothetical protein